MLLAGRQVADAKRGEQVPLSQSREQFFFDRFVFRALNPLHSAHPLRENEGGRKRGAGKAQKPFLDFPFRPSQPAPCGIAKPTEHSELATQLQ